MSESRSGLFGIHGQALMLRQERLQLLSANLANTDTPRYQAQDIHFESALQGAMGTGAQGVAQTQPGHMGTTDGAGKTERFYRTPLQPSLDGNTVDGNFEQAAFGRAALEYRISLSFVESQARTLLTAITGQ